MSDPGDEDDGDDRRWIARRLATARIHRFLGVRALYPARRLPPLSDQDPGDEEPRLVADLTRLSEMV